MIDSFTKGASNATKNASNRASNLLNLNSLSTSLTGNDKRISVALGTFLLDRDIDGTKWNKLFPYVFRIGGPNTNNTTSGLNSVSPIIPQNSVINAMTGKKGSNTLGSEQDYIVLPISPSNIQVSTPTAVNLSVTLNGILEEHNGSPIRNITISGTTGVTPVRGDNYANKGALSRALNSNVLGKLANDVFGNTIRASEGFVQNLADPNSLIDTDFLEGRGDMAAETGIYGTGYWHFHKLVKFIDRFTALKKEKANKDKYLVFEMQKDDLHYKCTLRSFSFTKRAGTLEYDYTIQLTAWDYETISGQYSQRDSVNALFALTSTIRRTREKIQAYKTIIQGFRQDIGNIKKVAREMDLLIKSVTGTTPTVADMSDSIVGSFKPIITDNYDEFSSETLSTQGTLTQSKLKAFTSTYTQSSTSPSQNQRNKNLQATQGAQIEYIFSDPELSFDILSQVDTDRFDMPLDLQDSIDEEVTRVLELDVNYWKKVRSELEASSASIAAQLGAAGDRFNNQNGFYMENAEYRRLRPAQLEVLTTINDLIFAASKIILSLRNSSQAVKNYVDFYADLAADNGIDFETPGGKFAVPFPLGSTLQSLAVQYLGDANRWVEIAALNNLKAPYIDEEGFTRNIVGSATGKTFRISNYENLYVNQRIFIEAENLDAVAAKIKQIEILSELEAILTIDKDVTGYGESVDGAVRAYAPSTTNSNMLIMIPSINEPTILDENFKFSPDIEDQRAIGAMAKADLLLSSQGDIVFTSSGSAKVSSGVSNLVQAAKLKLLTPRGSLINYSWYGSGVLPGTNTADIDASQIKKSLQETFQSDPRFGPILASRIQKSGVAMQTDVIVSLPDLDTTLPISVAVRQ